MRNEEVRDKFAQRIGELGQNVYNEKNVNAVIDSWLTDMGESVLKSNDRFFSYNVNLEDRAELMKAFFAERLKYMKEYVELLYENDLSEE